METLCPLVESDSEAVHGKLSLGGILRVFTRSAPSAQVEWLQAAGALAACCLWYTGIGRQSFPLSTLSAPHWAPRSCGNRHCPRCLAAKSWQWLEKQTRSLLPITYYHCVFTLPAELNSLMLANQRKLFGPAFAFHPAPEDTAQPPSYIAISGL